MALLLDMHLHQQYYHKLEAQFRNYESAYTEKYYEYRACVIKKKYMYNNMKKSLNLHEYKEIKWNVSQGRYDIDPIQSDQFSQSYLYSQPYEEIHLVSIIDPELYDIYGDLILVDNTENVYREYEIEDIDTSWNLKEEPASPFYSFLNYSL